MWSLLLRTNPAAAGKEGGKGVGKSRISISRFPLLLHLGRESLSCHPNSTAVWLGGGALLFFSSLLLGFGTFQLLLLPLLLHSPNARGLNFETAVQGLFKSGLEIVGK